MLTALPTTLRLVLAAFLWAKGPDHAAPAPLRFQLRHEHAAANGSRSVFADVSPSFLGEYYQVLIKTIATHQPPSAAAYSDARLLSMRHAQSPAFLWDPVEIPGPDVSKRETLRQLAKMTSNAYYAEPGHKSWYPLNGWNISVPFGWEPDADGMRGHVFVADNNSTVVISIKGGAGSWIAGGEGPTMKKDKLNVNLLFSCCCARVGPTWYTVCDCYAGGGKCDQRCVEQSLLDNNLFYAIGTNLYNDVAYMYPNANIWLVGHSLGGALASLLGATFGAPAVAFETPGDKLAATRLHLPSPPSTQHITHVYHTADPLATGACIGVTSVCALGGFALDCHLGQRILYDTVAQRKWAVDARTHGIQFVLDNLLNADWDPARGVAVPAVDVQAGCVECVDWEYGDFK
ncbi:Alpha/Beta hydrolase protein [Mycena rosella]|uniref:triacylglycerol lipase n=1 Tax=Mycena rosella TaxID=1033263 RepID=A0AAD7D7K4_MYCRO|nr:Alpha/Beta hydrolase protein [Mycena rosella]